MKFFYLRSHILKWASSAVEIKMFPSWAGWGLNFASLTTSVWASSNLMIGSDPFSMSHIQISYWEHEASWVVLYLFQLRAKLSSSSPLRVYNSFGFSSLLAWSPRISLSLGNSYKLMTPELVILATIPLFYTPSIRGMHLALITSCSWVSSSTISILLSSFYFDTKVFFYSFIERFWSLGRRTLANCSLLSVDSSRWWVPTMK